MLAKVITEDNRGYYSTVFGSFGDGWYRFLITYDDAKDCFDAVYMYRTEPHITRKVFILDCDESEWKTSDAVYLEGGLSDKDAKGYPWLLDNPELVSKIFHGEAVDASYKAIAKEMNAALRIGEWKYVETEADAENLMSAAWGFHDGIIQGISYKTDTYDTSRAEVVFGGCWNCTVTLVFEGDIVAHYARLERSDIYIFDATLLFENGYVYWVNCDAKAVDEISENCIYFRGRSLKWKIETEE